MSESDDDRIRRAFSTLRAVDARKAPSFAASRVRPSPRPLRPLRVASPIVAIVAAAAVFVAVCAAPSHDAPQSTAANARPSASGMVASAPMPAAPEPLPLDFLLEDTFSFSPGGPAFLARVPDFDADPSRGTLP